MSERNSPVILYIEDDAEMIDLVTLILSRQGYQVIGAHGGRQGLDMVRQEQPDAILLDLMMPDMDGWDVYQQVKADKTTAHIPVMVISAKTQTIDQVLGLHVAKVDAYVCKPFHPQELIHSLEKILNR